MKSLEKIINPKYLMIIKIKKPEIPKKIKNYAKKYNLVKKDEYHISIVVTKNAYNIRHHIKNKENKDVIYNEIKNLFQGFLWEYTLTNEYFLQEHFYKKENMEELGCSEFPEHTRRTIIQKIILPDMNRFYKILLEKYNIKMEIPVPHITLFSWSNYKPLMKQGIGISSKKDFQEYLVKKLK